MSADLAFVVSELGKECPWTQTITPAQMVAWLRSECDELRDEVVAIEAVGMCVFSGNPTWISKWWRPALHLCLCAGHTKFPWRRRDVCKWHQLII
jgi:hypothetical protein